MLEWSNFVKFQLKSEYMTLQQLLKASDIISSGGEAKFYLADHPVKVNGQWENRRGRKLYHGDVVIVENQGLNWNECTTFEFDGIS